MDFINLSAALIMTLIPSLRKVTFLIPKPFGGSLKKFLDWIQRYVFDQSLTVNLTSTMSLFDKKEIGKTIWIGRQVKKDKIDCAALEKGLKSKKRFFI